MPISSKEFPKLSWLQAKHAVLGMTRVAAVEHAADKIRVRSQPKIVSVRRAR